MVCFLLGGAILAWHVFDDTPQPTEAQNVAGTLDLSRLLVLVDADMAATAYADGQLHPIDGADDLLIRLDSPSGEVARANLAVTNSVMSWPGAMTVSPDRRFAYVAADRGQVERSIAAFDDFYEGMPKTRTLSVISVEDMEVVAQLEVCQNPHAIDVAPSGGWLAVFCGDPAGEIAIIALEDGLPDSQPDALRSFDLDLPDLAMVPRDQGLTFGAVHPSGAAAGIILSNVGVSLVRFDLDENGVPISAVAEEPTRAGGLLSMARWTRAGNHLLVADTGWGPAPTDALFNGPGAVLSFALSPSDSERGVVSTARVGKSPEAIELNRNGDLLIAVNMERTGVPGGLLSIVPGRSASSLSLVAVDQDSGTLTTLHDPVGFRGVLPEDAVFDADGDHLAIVVFQDHDAPRSDGWIEVFGIEGSGNDRQIIPTGRRIELPRGAHDLFAID